MFVVYVYAWAGGFAAVFGGALGRAEALLCR
jgi:hypothetical protein